MAIKEGENIGKPLTTTEAFTSIMASPPAVHTVAHKRRGRMKPVCSVSQDDIPHAIDVCDDDDAYLSVNAFIAPNSPDSYGHMKEKFISRFVACYSDIDNYKKGRDAFEAFGEIARLAFHKHIPQPSVIALSGRGLYLRWILKAPAADGQPELLGLSYYPPVDEIDSAGKLRHNRRHEYKKVLYAQVQNAIFDRLEYLGADRSARDMARVLRAPNSIHSGATEATGEEVRVQYYAGVDPKTGYPYRYTLPELARAFGVPLTDDEKPIGFENRSVKAPGSIPARRNGQRQLGVLRVTDYQTIERTMWLPKQGNRLRCLLFLADSLRLSGENQAEARRVVSLAAQRCEPPYPSSTSDSTIEQIVNDAYSQRLKYSNETLCRIFGINEENCHDLLTIKPDMPRTFCRATAAKHRREFVSEFTQNSPDASLREICTAANEHGHECSHQTIKNDLVHLGIGQSKTEPSLFE